MSRAEVPRESEPKRAEIVRKNQPFLLFKPERTTVCGTPSDKYGLPTNYLASDIKLALSDTTVSLTICARWSLMDGLEQNSGITPFSRDDDHPIKDTDVSRLIEEYLPHRPFFSKTPEEEAIIRNPLLLEVRGEIPNMMNKNSLKGIQLQLPDVGLQANRDQDPFDHKSILFYSFYPTETGPINDDANDQGVQIFLPADKGKLERITGKFIIEND